MKRTEASIYFIPSQKILQYYYTFYFLLYFRIIKQSQLYNVNNRNCNSRYK